jgi:hypothetical protein
MDEARIGQIVFMVPEAGGDETEQAISEMNTAHVVVMDDKGELRAVALFGSENHAKGGLWAGHFNLDNFVGSLASAFRMRASELRKWADENILVAERFEKRVEELEPAEEE